MSRPPCPASRPTRRQACALAAGAAFTPLVMPAEVRPWPAARPVPPLSLQDLDGRAWSLAALRGRPVVLNFWATWCQPCRDEMPSLELMAARHEAQGLQLLALNYQEGERTVRRFLDNLLVSFPVLLDLRGEVARAWDVRLFPSTVLIGRDGRPQRLVRGELDWTGEAARSLLAPLLA